MRCAERRWSHPDGASDFQRLSSPSHRGHLVGIASAAVTRCVSGDRLLITTVRDLSFFPVSGLQDNFGTLYRFNSPNKTVKINKLVVEALYMGRPNPIYKSERTPANDVKTKQYCYVWQFSPFSKRRNALVLSF